MGAQDLYIARAQQKDVARDVSPYIYTYIFYMILYFVVVPPELALLGFSCVLNIKATGSRWLGGWGWLCISGLPCPYGKKFNNRVDVI